MTAIFLYNRRALLALLHDVTMAAIPLLASLCPRLGKSVLDYKPMMTALYVASFIVIAVCVFLLTRAAVSP
jgi:hypothetical protein